MKRGVALVQALIVVAALAALSAAALVVATRGTARLTLAMDAAQARAYLDAAQDQARAELAVALAGGPALGPATAWDAPRDVPIDRGRVAWRVHDLQGRFNLTWLADEGEWGDQARAAFARLASDAGLPAGLTGRLIRALGPDEISRASAFGAARAPDLPLRVPQALQSVPTAADGGPAALAPLWPLVTVLPAQARWNPLTAPMPVLQALIPGLSPAAWAAFEAERASGAMTPAEAVYFWAAEYWPEAAQATLAALPLGAEAAWIGLDLSAQLDGVRLRRSLVLAVGTGPDGRPDLPVVLSLPVFD